MINFETKDLTIREYEDFIKSKPSSDELGFKLDFASTRGNIRAMEMLLDAGADIHFEFDKPLRSSMGFGVDKSVNFLLKKGAFDFFSLALSSGDFKTSYGHDFSHKGLLSWYKNKGHDHMVDSYNTHYSKYLSRKR